MLSNEPILNGDIPKNTNKTVFFSATLRVEKMENGTSQSVQRDGTLKGQEPFWPARVAGHWTSPSGLRTNSHHNSKFIASVLQNLIATLDEVVVFLFGPNGFVSRQYTLC